MSKSVLEEILEWSHERPDWQRDALRRLFATGITAKDKADLVELSKAGRGLVDPKKPKVLSKEHLPIESESIEPTSLVSITHHRGVNALAPEQTITVGPNLTIVYGQNAAGKSGYTRILKQACRCRQVEEILGNVLREEAPLAPQATIKYRTGAKDIPFSWSPEVDPSDGLAAINVFDARSAPIYLRDKTDVAFRPFGLDIFDQLSGLCGEVRSRLEIEYAALNAITPSLPNVPLGTRARSLIDNLTSLTKLDDVRSLANLSADEKRRLKELRDQQRDLQATDPRQRARELALRAGRIELVARHVQNLHSAMSAAALTKLQSAAEAVRVARKALETLRKTALTPDLLPGTGEGAWTAMWEAAEEFSAGAYSDSSFPILKQGARCPFCQQVIGAETRARLKHFAEYVSSTAQAELTRTEDSYQNAIENVSRITIERDDINLAIEELSSDDAELAERVRTFLEEAARFQKTVSKASASKTSLPARGVNGAPTVLLQSAAKTLRDRADQLKAQLTTMPPKLAAELSELESRVLFKERLQDVENEVERRQRLAAYRQCLDDTSTVSITRKSTELTKRLITEQL